MDLDFLTKLPRPYAQEALVLIRRLEFLKTVMTDDSHTSHEILSDVGDLQDFTYNYFKAHNTTLSEFAVKYDRYHLNQVLETQASNIEDED
jgi:hypothetical protein